MQTAKTLNMPLRVMGEIQDGAYWEECQRMHPGVLLDVTGFLDTARLQAALGECAAFLMPSRWFEAYGIVVIEALACGVPVVCNQNDGPGEIIREGVTGYHVMRDSHDMAGAVKKAMLLNRLHCRADAESRYSLVSFGMALRKWVEDAAADYSPR